MKSAWLWLVLLLGLSSTLIPRQALAQQSDRFLTAQECMRCHSVIPVPDGAVDVASHWTPHRLRPDANLGPSLVGPGDLWKGSMMSYSARDPYWKAKVRFESALTPAASAQIEDKCLSCHAPMQHQDFLRAGQLMAFDQIAGLGQEGVSCTVCHQIQPDGLGSIESFNAGFKISNSRRIFGPHNDLYTSPMWSETGYLPEYGSHLQSSALCATCHTVITKTLDDDGNPGSDFLQQAPYLEWLASNFALNSQTCQSCHMPAVIDVHGQPAAQYVAQQPSGAPFGPTAPRAPFGQHFFVGGNVQMLGMLREIYPQESATLLKSSQRARASLRDALELRVRSSIVDGLLNVRVQTVNRTGHKLPTAYPSRRVWLYLSVLDRNNSKVFESGAFDSVTGEIVGRNFPAEPHHQVIRSENDVMIYEAELSNSAGEHTVSLTRAAGFLKDNRIPPEGFDPSRLAGLGLGQFDLNRVGVGNDPDFLAGADQVRYEIDLPQEAQGPFRVTVRAYFQSVKPNHLEGMSPDNSEEEKDFLSRFPRHSRPALMAEDIQLVAQ